MSPQYWRVTAPLLWTSMILGVILAIGCPRNDATPEPETPQAPRPRPPDRQVLAPIEIPIEPIAMPYLTNDDGDRIETSCFQLLDLVDVRDAGSKTYDHAKRHRKAVSRTFHRWLREKIDPTSVSDSVIAQWNVTPEVIVVRSVNDEEVRFVEEPDCIDPGTGWLEEGVRVVTAIFGAKTLTFSAGTPLKRDKAREFLDELESAGLTVATDDLIDYELVLDDDESPREGPDGEKLYRDPEGGIQSAQDIITPKRQRMKTWTVETEEPIYFAIRELSNNAWRRESKADVCNVNLVWSDPTFREPDCAEFSGTGFKAAQKGDQVELKMMTGDQERTFLMDFEDVQKVQVGNRAIIWVSPVKIEEGALIRVNSLTLGPIMP